MSHSDEIARIRAEADQGRAGAKELARTLGGFYKELRSSGFSRGQSLELTKLWLTSLLGCLLLTPQILIGAFLFSLGICLLVAGAVV